ncbi:MAG: hypothetical protein ACR2HY_07830 [Acidimicrobiales bacterium]
MNQPLAPSLAFEQADLDVFIARLDLDGNGVGADGARAIASGLGHLTSLDLSNNGVGADGARAILDAHAVKSTLGVLDPRGNDLGTDLLPPELLETTDARSILAAYRRFTAPSVELRPLNEAKLLVLGNEAVGKDDPSTLPHHRADP